MKLIATTALCILLIPASFLGAKLVVLDTNTDPYGNHGVIGYWDSPPIWPEKNDVTLTAQHYSLHASAAVAYEDEEFHKQVIEKYGTIQANTPESLHLVITENGFAQAKAAAAEWSYYVGTDQFSLYDDSSLAEVQGYWSFYPDSAKTDVFINITCPQEMWHPLYMKSEFSIYDIDSEMTIWSDSLQYDYQYLSADPSTILYRLNLDPTHEYRLNFHARSSSMNDGGWNIDCDVRLISAVIPLPAAVYLALTGMGCLLPSAVRGRRGRQTIRKK